MSDSSRRFPTYAELMGTKNEPVGTSWNVFDNNLGTLNFTSPEARVAAAREIRSGAVFPLNLPTTFPDPPILGRRPMEHHLVDLDGGFDDYYDSYFPQGSSQWDALFHVEHPTLGFYRGMDVNEVTSSGSPLGIDQWADQGIAGRFVLADVSGYLRRLGTPLDASTSFSITTELLDAVLKEQGITLQEGDILLINTGWVAWYRTLSGEQRTVLGDGSLFDAPGLDPAEETARWLWDHRVAAVAADCPALERMPFDKSHEDGFLHLRLIPKLGFAIGELFDLEALAIDCERDGRYQGFFASAPINTAGGAGSPANALAIK